MNNWQPLQIPTESVSSRLKKLLITLLAFSLYFMAPAQPLADPKTSELLKPPTAP